MSVRRAPAIGEWLTWTDALVVMMAVALVGAAYAILWRVESTSLEVEIWSQGERVETLPLAEDRRVDVHGALGISHIEIKHAQVRFVSSPCSNKLCIQAGWQRHAGETVACLPNQVSVRILGRDRRYDAINF